MRLLVLQGLAKMRMPFLSRILEYGKNELYLGTAYDQVLLSSLFFGSAKCIDPLAQHRRNDDRNVA